MGEGSRATDSEGGGRFAEKNQGPAGIFKLGKREGRKRGRRGKSPSLGTQDLGSLREVVG